MDRRTALKHFLFISAGVVFIPSCSQNKNKSSIVLKNLTVNKKEEALLEEICDAIIPSTDQPGAREILAHFFVLKMIDDCVAKEDQIKMLKGMSMFNRKSKIVYGKDFIDCDKAERNNLIAAIEENVGIPNEISFFYKTVKDLTITAYTTSKYYLTQINIYELIPGRFHGCVPINSTNPA